MDDRMKLSKLALITRMFFYYLGKLPHQRCCECGNDEGSNMGKCDTCNDHVLRPLEGGDDVLELPPPLPGGGHVG